MNIIILFWILFVTSIIGYFVTNKNITNKKKVNPRIIDKRNIKPGFLKFLNIPFYPPLTIDQAFLHQEYFDSQYWLYLVFENLNKYHF